MSDPQGSPIRRDHPSPLVAPVLVELGSAGRATSTFTLDAAEPLLAGHYPGFPIFPGVCLVECAHLTALGAVTAGSATPVELAAIESARFLGPVFPGDTVHTQTVAEAVQDGWRCRAELAAEAPGGGPRRQVAVVRLRYGAGPA